MRSIFLTGVLLISGCSTLHVDHGYFIESTEGNASYSKECEKSGDYGDAVKVRYDNQNDLKIFFWYQTGMAFAGPIFLPVFPIFWKWGGPSDIGLRVESTVNLKFDQSLWKIKLNDDPTWLLARKIDQDWLAKCNSPENLKKRTSGQMDFIVCPPQAMGWVLFDFKEKGLPDNVVLSIDGVTISGKPQVKKEIVFTRDGNLHYVPISLLHSDWPYTSHLPCTSK